jgi:hypothetical protein
VLEQVLKFLLSDVVTPSLKNMEMVMCVWLEDEAQKGLSVSGGMARRGAVMVPIKVGLKIPRSR